VKGVRFADHRVVGGILELAARYRDDGADELVFYDITASPAGRAVDFDWVRRVTELLDIPFCVAGGIRTVAAAEAVLEAGADKISINSPALENPPLIDELAKRFGSQCVVIGVDSRRGGEKEPFTVYQYTGDALRMRPSGRLTMDWVREVQQRGAGEIVLNSMATDGVRSGYDLAQLREVRAITTVPLVASGGAGCAQHFHAVFACGVDAALAASVFHTGALGITDIKRHLRAEGVEVRL
jgi:cyclase